MKLKTLLLSTAVTLATAQFAFAQNPVTTDSSGAQTVSGYQYNNASIVSTLNGTLSSITGDINATAAAIGNSQTIKGF